MLTISQGGTIKRLRDNHVQQSKENELLARLIWSVSICSFGNELVFTIFTKDLGLFRHPLWLLNLPVLINGLCIIALALGSLFLPSQFWLLSSGSKHKKVSGRNSQCLHNQPFLALLAINGHPPSENLAHASHHSTMRQIISLKAVHTMAFYLLVYVGVEFTLGGSYG